MEEFDADDSRALAHSWKAHEWTADEVQFVAQLLQHGDPGRAWGSIYRDRDGVRYTRPTCLLKGEEMADLPHIKDYVSYVRQKIRERMEVSKEGLLDELSYLARSNMADFIVIQEDGTFYTDFSGLTREQLAAVQEVTVETYTEGRGEDAVPVKSVKFKLAPKTAAIELLGKNQKLWTDVIESTDLTEMSDTITQRRRERQQRQAEMAAQQAEDATTEEDEEHGRPSEHEGD